MTNGFTA